jgi:NAD(P)H-dependent FMN reductase
MSSPLALAVILASTREGRFGPTVAAWFMRELGARTDVDAVLVDLAETAVVPAADAYVVVTPEYNHSFPGPLKAVIDAHVAEWRARPVGFVSYGGMSGGLRAVEHLRGVFAELHAVTVRDTVSFHGGRQRFDADGRPVEPAGCRAAARALLDQLVWWGDALRDAHARRPYAARRAELPDRTRADAGFPDLTRADADLAESGEWTGTTPDAVVAALGPWPEGLLSYPAPGAHARGSTRCSTRSPPTSTSPAAASAGSSN